MSRETHKRVNMDVQFYNGETKRIAAATSETQAVNAAVRNIRRNARYVDLLRRVCMEDYKVPILTALSFDPFTEVRMTAAFRGVQLTGIGFSRRVKMDHPNVSAGLSKAMYEAWKNWLLRACWVLREQDEVDQESVEQDPRCVPTAIAGSQTTWIRADEKHPSWP